MQNRVGGDAMTVHEYAGKPAPHELLVNVPRLISAYFVHRPAQDHALAPVSFGTSGHRGSSLSDSFNETHILATTQAVCDHRRSEGITGPLFLGMDTHALSEPCFATAVEVLAANHVHLCIQDGMGYTPTPVISHAILTWNRHRKTAPADGIVLTPSHNPPQDGGFKYNPPHGGPAETAITHWIETRANDYLEKANTAVRRMPFTRAMASEFITRQDLIAAYVADLENILEMSAIAAAGIKIGVDPMGGAAVTCWDRIAQHYGLSLEVVNPRVDPTFGFMTVDHDGKIRMDCSSAFAMARLIDLKDRFDIAFGNDPDVDRHGIVTPNGGLLPPNHYLAVAIWYLFQNRAGWSAKASVGKTLVSSSMIDRVAKGLGRRLTEVPVGFKWFVKGLLYGTCGFGGEESAGASFLRKDGTVWTTDKDGMIMNLLAAEITARTGKDPSEHYQALTGQFGTPVYERIDAPATNEQKKILGRLSPQDVLADQLAGEPIQAKLTHAPGNQEAIGGLKVVAANGWFAARPSGTEAIYKIYAESFIGRDHLAQIQKEAQQIVSSLFTEHPSR
jgi:phosphoglucomutase